MTTTISYIDIMPCSRYEQMTFSEKEYSFSFLHKIWGMACSLLGAGFEHMWIAKAEAKDLCERYKIEGWSKERLTKEIERHSNYTADVTTAHKMSDYLGSVFNCIVSDVIVGGVIAGLSALGVISGVVMIPSVLILFVLLLITILKMPFDKLLVRTGFKQMIKGYLEKQD